MKPPSYITHQNREFYCVRKYRGILSTVRKDEVRARLEDRKLDRWHSPLDLRIQLSRHMNKGMYWFGGPLCR